MKRVEMKYKELGNQLLKANPEKVRHQAHKSSKKYEGKLKWQKVDHSTADIATVLTTSRLTTTNSQSTMSEGVRRQSADDVTTENKIPTSHHAQDPGLRDRTTATTNGKNGLLALIMRQVDIVVD